MQNPDISFIQLKIANIGTALFYCGANSQLPFSTYIITALKLDEDGCVWFFISSGPDKQINIIRPFEAQLEFYRKGYPFFMKIEGQASIADTKEKMQDLMGKGILLPEETLSGILLKKNYIVKLIETKKGVKNELDCRKDKVARVQSDLKSQAVVYSILQIPPGISLSC